MNISDMKIKYIKENEIINYINSEYFCPVSTLGYMYIVMLKNEIGYMHNKRIVFRV